MIGVLSLLVMVAVVATDDKVEYGRRFRTKKRHLRRGTNNIIRTGTATITTDLTEDVAFWTRQLVYSMPPSYPVPTPTVQVTTNPPVPDNTIDITDPPTVPDTIDTYQPSGGGGTVEAPDTTEPVLTDPPISSSTEPPAPAPLSPFPTETEGSFKTRSPTVVGFTKPPFDSNPPVEFMSNTPTNPPVIPVTPVSSAAMASETLTPTTAAVSSTPPAPPIDEVLENTIDLSALKTLLESVGVLDDLESIGPFTVFGKEMMCACKPVLYYNIYVTLTNPLRSNTSTAPNNDAISKFIESLPDGLPDSKVIEDIILYHVTLGRYPSSTLTSGDLGTVNGESVSVIVLDTGVTVNGANVIGPDYFVLDGVVHIIDTVLIPPDLDLTATSSRTKEEV